MIMVKFAPMVLAAAEVPTFDIATTMTESVGTVQSQLFSVLTVVVPAIVAVTAAVVAVKFGVSWLKKIRA